MAAPLDQTETGMANRALALIGEPPIASLDDAKRSAARHAKRNFADIRDSTLRAIPWQFAKQSTTPPALPVAPNTRYAFRYLMPADCISVNAIGDCTTTDAWEVEATGDDTTLVTALDTSIVAPLVWYTRRIVNPAQWDEEFADAFVQRFCARLNPLIGRDKTKTPLFIAEGKRLLDEAALRDAQQRSRQQVSRNTSWIASRFGAYAR